MLNSPMVPSKFYTRKLSLPSIQMVPFRIFLAFVFFLVATNISCATAQEEPQQQQIIITVINRSPEKVRIYWNENGSLMTKPDIKSQANFSLHAFPGHSFTIHQFGQKNWTKMIFSATEEDDQVVTITPDWNLERTDAKSSARERANEIVDTCQKLHSNSHLPGVSVCVKERLAAAIASSRDEILFYNQRRQEISQEWEEYACDDNELETSEPLEEFTWIHGEEEEEDQYHVQILHDYSSSQIHVLEDFISPDECRAVLEESREGLRRAQVHDGRGGSRFSEHRKAWQSGIEVDWEMEDEGDLIARVSRRVYDYTNYVLGLDISEDGQENLMSIQYFGSNDPDAPPDRYMPHCDGPCDGRPHKRGNRIATMVMYCEVPSVGGHTNFRNAGVHVMPSTGAAVFFSYVDPNTFVTDKGYTSHSGCPVYEGSKKIVTQWVRLGVDEDNPSDSFNSLGIQEEGYFDSDDEESDEDEDEDEEENSVIDENTSGSIRNRGISVREKRRPVWRKVIRARGSRHMIMRRKLSFGREKIRGQ